MGQGAYIDIVNSTESALKLGDYHSYQMNAWDGNLPKNVEGCNSSSFYVEWDEKLYHTHSDDAAEAQYLDGQKVLFEIQARWRHLQVQCLDTNANYAIGILKNSKFSDSKTPTWHPIASKKIYDLGWNHDQHMVLAIVDLRLLFGEDKLDQYIDAIQNDTLSDSERKTLYELTRIWSGYKAAQWEYVIVDIKYENPKLPKGNQVDIAVESDISIPKGVETEHLFRHERKISSTFEYNFTETLAVGSTMKFEAGIPFAACTEAEISVEVKLEAGQKWSDTIDETYEVSDTVKISKGGRYNIRAYVDFAEEFKVQFDAVCKISAKAGEYIIPASMVQKLMLSVKYGKNFTGKIVGVPSPNEIRATISGFFVGDYGVKRHLEVQRADKNAILETRDY